MRLLVNHGFFGSLLLGMNFALTTELDKEKAAEMQKKLKKSQFDFNDYLDQMQQVRNMGGLGSIMKMMPGVSGKVDEAEFDQAEKQLRRTEAIIMSMTPEERVNPDLLNPSRKNRIARGCGMDIAEINRFIKQFREAQKMMKKLPGLMKGGRKRRGFGGFPGGGGFGGF